MQSEREDILASEEVDLISHSQADRLLKQRTVVAMRARRIPFREIERRLDREENLNDLRESAKRGGVWRRFVQAICHWFRRRQ